MAIHRVTVTASYDAAAAPPQTFDNLMVWASADLDRSFEIDHEIEPGRWTATAVYRIDASSREEAEHVALAQFASDSVDAGISNPETVLGTADPD